MPQSATYVLSIRATHDPTRNTEQAWHPAVRRGMKQEDHGDPFGVAMPPLDREIRDGAARVRRGR